LRELGRRARLGRDVALAWNDARAFRAYVTSATERGEVVALAALDRRDLVEVLEQRMRLVTRALALLERCRLATLSVLPLLSAACGELPRELFDALSAPRRTPERAQLDAELVAFAQRCRALLGRLCVPPAASPELSQDWGRLKQAFRHVRMLGMDVRPRALGDSDEDLLSAIEEACALQAADPEEARRAAEPKVLRLSARGPLGLLGVAPAGGLVLLLGRIADAKGALAEGLAAALLQLRTGALEAGRRLVADGVLEQAEDTLFMPLQEIEEALEGELGAYAARVRLRREDDRRWRNFAAPRWIAGRRSESALL
jgi:hypothetical protein